MGSSMCACLKGRASQAEVYGSKGQHNNESQGRGVVAEVCLAGTVLPSEPAAPMGSSVLIHTLIGPPLVADPNHRDCSAEAMYEKICILVTS
ncbi:hypothetical protein E2C01_058424 [Portunus trituberculatus]|uniref:Uncharacterized protein n=1 Tax=Portunus trituberculatus TaxID=210409 RepID=A0A5B7GZS6_PORTR|nr:hypothetical protein [Portunus trituberculatus]